MPLDGVKKFALSPFKRTATLLVEMQDTMRFMSLGGKLKQTRVFQMGDHSSLSKVFSRCHFPWFHFLVKATCCHGVSSLPLLVLSGYMPWVVFSAACWVAGSGGTILGAVFLLIHSTSVCPSIPQVVQRMLWPLYASACRWWPMVMCFLNGIPMGTSIQMRA